MPVMAITLPYAFDTSGVVKVILRGVLGLLLVMKQVLWLFHRPTRLIGRVPLATTEASLMPEQVCAR